MFSHLFSALQPKLVFVRVQLPFPTSSSNPLFSGTTPPHAVLCSRTRAIPTEENRKTFSLLPHHSFPALSSALPRQRQHTATGSHSVALVVAKKPTLAVLGNSTFFIGPCCVERRHSDHVTGAHDRRGIHTSTVEAAQRWRERLWSHRPTEDFCACAATSVYTVCVCVYATLNSHLFVFFPSHRSLLPIIISLQITHFIHKYISFCVFLFVCFSTNTQILVPPAGAMSRIPAPKWVCSCP